jgi:hypothetical protein
MRAAVEAAENWGTYIIVHAYTNKAVNQAIEAGVKCIDHGQLLEDEEPFKAMAKKGVWLSLQAFFNDGDRKSPYPEGSDKYKKQMLLYAGTKRAYRWPSSTGSSWPGALTCCTTPPMRRSRGGCAPSRNESFDTFWRPPPAKVVAVPSRINATHSAPRTCGSNPGCCRFV